jgi:hypothetical protein
MPSGSLATRSKAGLTCAAARAVAKRWDDTRSSGWPGCTPRSHPCQPEGDIMYVYGLILRVGDGTLGSSCVVRPSRASMYVFVYELEPRVASRAPVTLRDSCSHLGSDSSAWCLACMRATNTSTARLQSLSPTLPPPCMLDWARRQRCVRRIGFFPRAPIDSLRASPRARSPPRASAF